MLRANHHRLARDLSDLFPFADPSKPSSPPAGGDGGNKSNSAPPQQPSSSPPAPSSTPSKGNNNNDGKEQNNNQSSSPPRSTTTSTPEPASKTSNLTQSTSTPPPSSALPSSTSLKPSSTSKTTPIVAGNNVKSQTDRFSTPVGDLGSMTTAPGISESPSSNPVGASGDINVGAVIGGVAGGIAAVALIFFVCMFFIRRRRNNNSDEFDPVSFRKSASMMNETSDPFNPRPPTMIERKLTGHNVAPSVSSFQGANMAGAGAYSGHGSDEGHQYDVYQQQPYQAHQPIQPRQQYTYGQTYDNGAYGPEGSDHGHDVEYNGPYSSEPHAQDIYAAEAYAYPHDDQVVVSPGMHSQEMGHYNHQQQQHDAYGGM
ncbi:hypothetical protein MIND_00325300 [Mycena indigotica]|uniref:Uncharacterized protein n=1 Tax=Mycena indigotica TaxID=2126181 RepID=A0A8H6T274_9AGAR|nr:uncharacterized protein MIND_00325300 [Mycena indigotica]KAF7309544.1 hypothetical protein MIND_00325300 [Mycena indigotica]